MATASLESSGMYDRESMCVGVGNERVRATVAAAGSDRIVQQEGRETYCISTAPTPSPIFSAHSRLHTPLRRLLLLCTRPGAIVGGTSGRCLPVCARGEQRK